MWPDYLINPPQALASSPTSSISKRCKNSSTREHSIPQQRALHQSIPCNIHRAVVLHLRTERRYDTGVRGSGETCEGEGSSVYEPVLLGPQLPSDVVSLLLVFPSLHSIFTQFFLTTVASEPIIR